MEGLAGEKRVNGRKIVFEEVVLESSSGKRTSRISDLSLGGCYVETITPFTEGDQVAFKLTTNTGNSLRFSGQISYVLSGSGFGIKFADMDEQRSNFLNSLLA